MMAVIEQEMQATKERFFAFISKLEEKLTAFTESAIPELTDLADSDEDKHKSGYYRMMAAVLGQLESIWKKAAETKKEKITCFAYPSGDYQVSTAYYAFRNECYERFAMLEQLYRQCSERVKNAYTEDYEAEYKKILDEYEAIKDQFRCVQCSSPIFIDQIYATTTYLTCPACQTRNTFEPSSRTKGLEGLGRSLAEQRTAYLLHAHNEVAKEAQDAFSRLHQYKMNLSFENDIKDTAGLPELERQKQQLDTQRNAAYHTYLRAMFDEWNKINPALKEQHEKFHTRLLNEYNERN